MKTIKPLFTQNIFMFIALLLSFDVFAFSATKSKGGIDDLMITGVTVISPELSKVEKQATVLVRNGKIRYVGPNSSHFTASQHIDGRGQYLIPGLIDSHVHLYHATGLKHRYSDNFDTLYQEYMAQMPKSFLYHGFTTVVETNADIQTNQRFSAAPIAPDLVHCGAALVLNNGFMAMEFPKGQLLRYAPNFLFDHYGDSPLPKGAKAKEHTPEATVQRIAESGARCVKMHYEEALWMPEAGRNFVLPSEQIVKEVVRAAHQHNLKFVLHATSEQGYEFAKKTGVDVIAHGPWDWEHNDFSIPDAPEAIREIVARVSQTPAAIQPTISSLKHTASMFQPDLLNDSRLSHVVSKSYLNYLKGDAQQQRDLFLRIFGKRITAEPSVASLQPLMNTMIARYKGLVGEMYQNGAQLIFGTDTSSGGFGWGSPPGLTGYWELVDWSESGISLSDIFRAVTINNAKAMGLEQVIGTVEPGKRANLLLLNSNPLKSITAYDDIHTVILGGASYPRALLSATNIQVDSVSLMDFSNEKVKSEE